MMASCLRMLRHLWRARVRDALPVIKSAVVICTLFALDVRDAVYKVVWIGVDDSFHFRTDSTLVLQAGPVVPVMTAQHNGSLASGWPSFLARCESITPFCEDGSTFFLSAVLGNCSLESSDLAPVSTSAPSLASETATAAADRTSLVFTANVRVDSLVWASCKLLFISRRPPICHEDIVANFHKRYAFRNRDVPLDWMAPVASPAEDELLRLLDLVSLSVPIHTIVCGEAFALDPQSGRTVEGLFTPTIYGCASPNLHRSEFVGLTNAAVHELQRDKAWLTADVIQVMTIHYGIRQNGISTYRVAHDAHDRVLLSPLTRANFSSFGQLYVLLILIDAALLVLHFLSSLEIFTWLLLPEAREIREHLTTTIARTASQLKVLFATARSSRIFNASSPALLTSRSTLTRPSGSTTQWVSEPQELLPPREGLLDENFFYSFFSRSLYRSEPVVLLTLVTQLLSWLLVLPNSVVWTWSDSLEQKLQACLSSLRVWVLLLLVTNGFWNVVVLASEERAYWFVRGTFVSSLEVVAIGAVVSFGLRDHVFAMCEAKWALERQRVSDTQSFPGSIAHGNTLSLGQDYLISTPSSVLWVIYEPLLLILAWSVLALVLYVSAKYVVLAQRVAWTARVEQLRRSLQLAAVSPEGRSGRSDSDRHGKPPATVRPRSLAPYARSPIEELLNTPVRAKSLIRNALAIEVVDARDGRAHIAPSCYLDFGVMMRDGHVRSRIGFASVLAKAQRPASDLTLALESHPQMTARRRSSTTTLAVVARTQSDVRPVQRHARL